MTCSAIIMWKYYMLTTMIFKQFLFHNVYCRISQEVIQGRIQGWGGVATLLSKHEPWRFHCMLRA